MSHKRLGTHYKKLQAHHIRVLVHHKRLQLFPSWQLQANLFHNTRRWHTFLSELCSFLRDLLSTQKMEPDDYRKMKAEYTDKIEKLLGKLANSSQTPVDFGGLLSTGLQNLMNLERLYKNGDIVKKREIIGSMYPENLTIDGFGVRTARPALFMNEGEKFNSIQ